MILTLPFLAQRNYLHGTTLFDALLNEIPGGSSVSYKIPRMILSNRISLEKFDETPEQQTEFAASLSWESDCAKGWIGIREQTRSETIERAAYPEDAVTKSAQFDEKRVSFSGASPFTFVATVVPLHKALLLRNKIVEGAGQWVFTRFDLKRVPETFEKLDVEIDRVLGKQLAKSTVIVDDAPIGTIYFSWLPAK